MSRRGTNDYPAAWPDIAYQVKVDAGWKCVRCGHRHDVDSGHVLTVHHLDMDKANCRWWNIPALCQRCHLSIQARVVMDRPWVMLEHTEWFRPYVAAFYAFKYLGEDLTREETLARMDELLQLERQAYGVAS